MDDMALLTATPFPLCLHISFVVKFGTELKVSVPMRGWMCTLGRGGQQGLIHFLQLWQWCASQHIFVYMYNSSYFEAQSNGHSNDSNDPREFAGTTIPSLRKVSPQRVSRWSLSCHTQSWSGLLLRASLLSNCVLVADSFPVVDAFLVVVLMFPPLWSALLYSRGARNTCNTDLPLASDRRSSHCRRLHLSIPTPVNTQTLVFVDFFRQ